MGIEVLDKLRGTWNHPPIHFPLVPRSTGLLIVDMQYMSAHPEYGLGKSLHGRSTPEGGYFFDRLEELVVPNIGRLLEYFREHELLIAYLVLGTESEHMLELTPLQRMKFGFRRAVSGVSYMRGTLEHRILPELEPRSGELVINKTTSSPFSSTAIDNILRNLGIDTLVVTGVSTNACVETTGRDAADRGFWTALVEDGCATRDQVIHDVTMANFRSIFGRVMSTSGVLEELERSRRE